MSPEEQITNSVPILEEQVTKEKKKKKEKLNPHRHNTARAVFLSLAIRASGSRSFLAAVDRGGGLSDRGRVPLALVNARNVNQLVIAWQPGIKRRAKTSRWRTGTREGARVNGNDKRPVQRVCYTVDVEGDDGDDVGDAG